MTPSRDSARFGEFVSDETCVRVREGASRALATQLHLASIAAPTGDESRRGRAMTGLLQHALQHAIRSPHPHGTVSLREDDVGNVIARVAPADPHLAATAPVSVLAHLDTVFDGATALAPRHEGERLLLPGICDNGRGLTALVSLAEECARQEFRARMSRPLELVATVGEEGLGNLRGARRYFDDCEASGALPVAALVLDGPGADTVVHHAIASVRLRVTVRGAGGHSWAGVGANAIHAAGVAIAEIARIVAPPHAAIAVTRVGGGEGITRTPACAWFDVDLRARESGALTLLRDALGRALHRAQQQPPFRDALLFEQSLLGERPAGALPEAHELVRLAARASEWQGYRPVSAMASTDANVPLSRGIPAIAIGAGGRGGSMHTNDEWYEDHDGYRGILRALAVVTALVRS